MNILFICKHNIFRSRVAEILFNRLNKKKSIKARSAGLIRWNEKDLKGDEGFKAEKKVAKSFGINLEVESKELNSSLLKEIDLLIIVADDVPKNVFETEKSFHGKILQWNTPDVKAKDKNKEEVARKTIIFIENKIKDFVNKIPN